MNHKASGWQDTNRFDITMDDWWFTRMKVLGTFHSAIQLLS
jgi:hypothetical protein